MIEEVTKDGNAVMHLRKQQISWTKERMAKVVQWVQKLIPRALNRIKGERVKRYVSQQKKKIHKGDFTVISQNCIGGVLYHDLEMKFLSPTINLFMRAPDFIKFVQNLEYYLCHELIMAWGEEYPIGYLDDVVLFFQHYTTCSEAKEKWEERKRRVCWDKIIVLCTDMEGFTEKEFNEWKTIKYPKLLFTTQDFQDDGIVSYPEYSRDGSVPDLIHRREYYKDGKLVAALNALLVQK